MHHSSHAILHSKNNLNSTSTKLSIIFVCLGEKNAISTNLRETLSMLRQIRQYIQLIVVLDKKQYLEMPDFQNIFNDFPSYKVITLQKTSNIPAKLFNVGIKHSDMPYISFAWPGSTFEWPISESAINSLDASSVYTMNNPSLNKIYFDPPSALIYGWLQCTKIYDLNNIMVSKDMVNKIGEFDESPLLQKDFDWEWLLRLSKHFIFKTMGTASENKMFFKNYPYEQVYEFDNDMVQRYVLRNKNIPFENSSNTTEPLFIKDLPAKCVEEINKVCLKNSLPTYSKSCTITKHLENKFKMTLIGGFWDYHHIQLCFLNYLDKLYGKGFATYKIIFDMLATPEDIYESDLVIIARSRHTNILNIINACKEKEIPTLYMIDDNWFTIAQDYPEDYGQLFIEGNPEYDSFISALEKCDAIITYNKHLYAYLYEYNKNIILFPLNINLDFYHEKVNKIDKDEIIIGYVGSLRYDDIAFKALANIAKNSHNITVLLFGVFSQNQLSLFEGVNVQILDFMPYPIFSKRICDISPDILLAPLSYNKTSESKCPNKYLEIGAIGSAGIYTDIYPYNEVVEHGITGLLVKNNTIQAWEENILRLIENKELLKEIQSNCHINVKNHFSTDKFIKRFMNTMRSMIQNRGV